MKKSTYIKALYENLICAHCGASRNSMGGGPRGRRGHVLLHHPRCDGDTVTRLTAIPADAPDLVVRLLIEAANCVPLCPSCHRKEHNRIAALGVDWHRGVSTGVTLAPVGRNWRNATSSAVQS